MASEDLNSSSYEQVLSQLQRLEDQHSIACIQEQLYLELKMVEVKQLLIKRCQQEANRLRSISAYTAALEKYLEIKTYQTNPTAVDKDIAELKTLIAQQDKVK